MGLAARCLRGLLGEKKSAEGGPQQEKLPTKEKKRWGFLKWSREREKDQLLRENVSDREKSGNFARDSDEQSKRAIAVAAATSTAELTSVASAQPAVTLVTMTRFRRRSEGFFAAVGMKLENRAAIKIQAAFRGYLARRALRALRGLVKLQALVRGSIVRKQAGETLRCMQALIRAQSRARDCRTLGSETTRCRSGCSNPGLPAPKIQSSRSLKRNSSKQKSMDAVYENGDRFTDWKWLDQWMEESYGDSREVSKRFYDQKNAKILEIDTGKPPQFISRHSFAAMTDSPSKVSTAAKLSITTRSSSVHMAGQSQSPLRFPIVGPEDFLSSPQLFAAASNPGVLRKGAFSPAKSHSSRSMFGGYSDYRNYMANTESFTAKARSQSAPKQIAEYRKSSSMKSLSDHGFGGQLPPPEAECSGSRSALRFQFGGRLD